MRAGNHNSSFWGKEIRQRIAEQVPYIKHWTIINDDYSVVSDMKNCTWFIDPPYQNAGVYYKQNKIDYEALGKWCLSLNGQVIVCEAMGASWLPFTPFVAAKANESKYGGKVSYECIYTNEPN
jgi:16S rRNA G966 N2-methylase RsmD